MAAPARRVHPTCNRQHIADRELTRIHDARRRNRQIGMELFAGFLVIAVIALLVSMLLLVPIVTG